MGATIQRIHQCTTAHTRTEAVCETADGRVLFEGKVEVFALLGHDRAFRGTIEVREEHGAPTVQIALELPQMFSTRAHHRTIVLDEAAVARLLESEHDGTFELTLDGPLDPAAASDCT